MVKKWAWRTDCGTVLTSIKDSQDVSHVKCKDSINVLCINARGIKNNKKIEEFASYAKK